MKILIKTLAGLEDILRNEIKDLGGTNIRTHKRAVSCEGDMEFIYKSNLYLRTALRVLVPIFEFEARHEQELYDKIYRFDWTEVMNKHQTFAIDNTVFSKYFKHSKFAALRAKDAIVDHFRDKFGDRPSVNVERPDLQLNLHAWNEKFSISLDSSGSPLNQRGYRSKGHRAPLNEVLAAGMIMMTEWKGDIPLLDPMCGSGTILMEAAMIALDIPPNVQRTDFGFKTWNDFEPMKWHRIRMDAEAAGKRKEISISGIDIDPKAIRLTNGALKSMRLDRLVKTRRMDFFSHKPTSGREGIIITNPPYGERIGEEVEDLYQKMGDHLKNHFEGYSAWILSSNRAAFKKLGLKPDQKIELFNGSLECQYCSYSLF